MSSFAPPHGHMWIKIWVTLWFSIPTFVLQNYLLSPDYTFMQLIILLQKLELQSSKRKDHRAVNANTHTKNLLSHLKVCFKKPVDYMVTFLGPLEGNIRSIRVSSQETQKTTLAFRLESLLHKRNVISF